MIYYTEDASVYKRAMIKRMGTPDRSAETARKPRTDAIRNRERVLEAAKAVFSAGGADASRGQEGWSWHRHALSSFPDA